MTPGDRAAELLRTLALDVRVWRIQRLDSARFFEQHGEVVSVEPLLVTGMARRTWRPACSTSS